MVAEIKVIIKDEEKTLTKKFLEYEPFQADDNDPIIVKYIEETLSNFDGEPSNIKVIITIEAC
jgi:hypothetical protein